MENKSVCVECLIGKQNKPTLFKVTEPNSVPYRAPPACAKVCVECLIGKQKKPILFKVTEPSSMPYRTHPACAKRAAYPDPPPAIPVPVTGAAQVQPPQVTVSWRTKTEMTEY